MILPREFPPQYFNETRTSSFLRIAFLILLLLSHILLLKQILVASATSLELLIPVGSSVRILLFPEIALILGATSIPLQRLSLLFQRLSLLLTKEVHQGKLTLTDLGKLVAWSHSIQRDEVSGGSIRTSLLDLSSHYVFNKYL